MLGRLEHFNALAEAEALVELLAVCASKVWARTLLDQRPFNNQAALLAASAAAWQLTCEADWLEAFDGHPKIGYTQALQGGPQTTAMQEQGQVKAALASTRQALARLNQAYLAQFGFIFIICASGQSAEAMLTVLEQSLSQSRADELQRAASEQFKILTGRLKAWFE